VGVTDLGVARSRDRSGALVVRVGVPLADVYLEFLGGRSRPNTVLAAGGAGLPPPTRLTSGIAAMRRCLARAFRCGGQCLQMSMRSS
jgi:hypothetical protein